MDDEKLHQLLPIGENEKIITTVKHHWFAYASIYFGAGLICVLVIALIILASVGQKTLGISGSSLSAAIALGLMFMACVILFSFIPVWMRKQEILVLTEEALLQVKKPSLFASKVSQLNLQHIADVTVEQDTLGAIFGFGHLTIETPGEQDNYEFSIVGDARTKAKAIIEAHENYAAALESGQIQTTLGQRPPVPGAAWRPAPPEAPPLASDQLDTVALSSAKAKQTSAADEDAPLNDESDQP